MAVVRLDGPKWIAVPVAVGAERSTPIASCFGDVEDSTSSQVLLEADLSKVSYECSNIGRKGYVRFVDVCVCAIGHGDWGSLCCRGFEFLLGTPGLTIAIRRRPSPR